MIVEPFSPDHFRELTLQPHQAAWQSTLASQDWTHLGEKGEAWTGLVDGKPVACIGVADMGFGRGEAWALLSQDAGRSMLQITRAVERWLRVGPYRYLQIHTAESFVAAHRWATMLGFASRGCLPGYCENGEDALIWTRTR